MRKTGFNNQFRHCMRDACRTAIFAFGLLFLIVGFQIQLGKDNQMILVNQMGYVLNYVAIIACARFVYVYFGKNKRSALLAMLPSFTLFTLYRSFLYYKFAAAQNTYDFKLQAVDLGIIFLIFFSILVVVYQYNFGKKVLPSFLSEALKSLKKKIQGKNNKILLGALLLYPILVVGLTDLTHSQKWIDNYAIQILIYVFLAWGLNIIVGFSGLFHLGYVGFYAIGAYTVALLSGVYQLPFIIYMPAAFLLAALLGTILGIPVLRLRGDYLAIVTLAFGEIIRIILINWMPVTGGAGGLFVPKVTFFGHPFSYGADGFAKTFGFQFSAAQYKIFLYYLLVGMLVLVYTVINRLRHSPIGRSWEALREDEIACKALGMNTVIVKLTAFAIGSGIAGLAGGYFAVRQTHIDPGSFVFMESVIVLAIVILGGMRSLLSIAISAAIMIGGMELLREIPNIQIVFGPEFEPEKYRMFWFGVAIMFVMILRPNGLSSLRRPTAFLTAQKKDVKQFANKDLR